MKYMFDNLPRIFKWVEVKTSKDFRHWGIIDTNIGGGIRLVDAYICPTALGCIWVFNVKLSRKCEKAELIRECNDLLERSFGDKFPNIVLNVGVINE